MKYYKNNRYENSKKGYFAAMFCKQKKMRRKCSKGISIPRFGAFKKALLQYFLLCMYKQTEQ